MLFNNMRKTAFSWIISSFMVIFKLSIPSPGASLYIPFFLIYVDKAVHVIDKTPGVSGISDRFMISMYSSIGMSSEQGASRK